MKKIVTGLLLLSALKGSSQQDPQYGLYQFNQMTINPAYAGARDALAAVIDFRKQWVSFPGAPSTFAASIHSPISNKKIGVGFNAFNDGIGAKNVTGAYLSGAYIAKLSNKVKLSFGLRAGYMNYKFNFSGINAKNAGDAAFADLASTNRGALDIDAGLFLRSNKFFMGLSSTHINHAPIYNNAITKNDTTYTVNYNLRSHSFFIVGYSFVINDNCVFAPSVMVKRNWNRVMSDVNLNFFFAKKIWFGIYSKMDYGVGFLFQVYATDQLRVGYSYDIGAGKYRGRLGPSHEIMIGFDFQKNKARTVSPRFL